MNRPIDRLSGAALLYCRANLAREDRSAGGDQRAREDVARCLDLLRDLADRSAEWTGGSDELVHLYTMLCSEVTRSVGYAQFGLDLLLKLSEAPGNQVSRKEFREQFVLLACAATSQDTGNIIRAMQQKLEQAGNLPMEAREMLNEELRQLADDDGGPLEIRPIRLPGP
jgi:hypothetical protein